MSAGIEAAGSDPSGSGPDREKSLWWLLDGWKGNEDESCDIPS